jgi:S1-C subfamily serine protease
MSDFDPRWSAGGRDDPGREPGEPGRQGESGAQPGDRYQPYPGYYGQHDYRSGAGLGDPSRGDAWSGYTYPGAYPNGEQQGDYRHTSRFDQPGWSQQGGQWTHQYPQYLPYQQRRRHPVRSSLIAIGAVGLSVLIGLGIGRLAWPSNSAADGVVNGGNQNFGSTEPPASGNGSGTTSINPSGIASKVDPGLVDINTVLGYKNAEAAGTGIVLTANGEILTNNHVVEGATSIKVTDIGNGRTYNASVVGFDRTEDIAVIQLVGASGLHTESLGDSSKVQVGDAVVGIGNAGGAGGTPSAAAGKVTGLNQSITASDDSSGASEQLTGLIQTDANIQSGDSGGSLVNSSGQVIGVDTAASSGFQFGGQGGLDPGGQGDQQPAHQGFAIPINHAISIAHEIIGEKASTTVHIGPTAFLGVGISDAGQDNGGFGGGNGFGNGNANGSQSGNGTGAEIDDTVSNGPAEQAGLQEGDVITALNGTKIQSATALTNLMDTHHPGDKLSVTYLDATGQQHTTTVVPVSGPVG